MQHAARKGTSERSAISSDMQKCIQACETCHSICLSTAMNHCLEKGGKYVEPQHFRLLTNCAEICQTSANFMLSNSDLHAKVCEVCAEVCDACAESCQQVGNMEECVQACQQCAQSCHEMAGHA
jgi:hypothetical protein